MPNLYTHDMGAALAFYRDGLGFSVSSQFPPDGPPEHVVLSSDSSMLALSLDGAIRDAGLEPTPGNPLELVVWSDDVDGHTARLASAGYDVLVAPYDHPGGHRRAYLADPDGNWVALVDA